MDIEISYGEQKHQFQPMTAETLDLLQIKPLEDPTTFESVTVQINGSGLAIATLQTSWYIPPQAVLDLESDDEPFEVKVTFMKKPVSEKRRKLSQIEESGSQCIIAGVYESLYQFKTLPASFISC